VAENQQKEIVGITICGPEQNQDSIYHAEIYVLYVLPQYPNQGIGRKLVGPVCNIFNNSLKQRPCSFG
jgi:ribosomal protein S18 acetylase RimI-like enzyme